MQTQLKPAASDRFSAVLRARCTPELKQRLDQYAQQHPLTRESADHIRAAVEEYLNRRSAEAQAS